MQAKTILCFADMIKLKAKLISQGGARNDLNLINFLVFGGSPVHKKSHSSMTMHSYSTTRSGSKEGKDGDTPTDSEGSLGIKNLI